MYRVSVDDAEHVYRVVYGEDLAVDGAVAIGIGEVVVFIRLEGTLFDVI